MYVPARPSVLYHPFQPAFEKQLSSYAEYKPSLSAPFGGGIQFYGFYMDDLNAGQMFVIPEGCMSLVICCYPDRPSANICGTLYKGRQGLFARSECEYFVIRFLPGYAEHFFRYPVGGFSEQEIPVGDVLPHAAELLERVVEQKTFEERVRAFEAYYEIYIRGRLAIPRLIEYLTDQIIHSRGTLQVTDLSRDTGYSSRYMIKAFEQYIGASPKLFSRIIRFQHVLELMEHNNYKETLEHIFELGYFDQNHFIKEFKEFSRTTPKKYTVQGTAGSLGAG
ncbi:helix-turn-helix domain-containing protein [Paenibacillus sp. MMS20-IR301]|uniref:helix-turn-helix domain-containing protein n=1 Tax=Paenibacillus sp. MMS20-IR301 TaxID=2895946 RepID=UPI0028E27E7E|nr:helix-turn-helix domain-containing protein [Paenibacillus sp. MMS20-IR301]WNS43675.1 helix-turn-helix domain-containing protein [Paenibacillus sp. MMS20-IR301]